MTDAPGSSHRPLKRSGWPKYTSHFMTATKSVEASCADSQENRVAA